MAHQTEIVINGVSTEVTEFDHTAQEIDDGIDKVNTLTGEDIPTSASDPTSISSQLSKTLMQMNGINMLGDINNVSDLPSGRSALFRTTDSNWGGILPYTYAFYARLRSGVSGSYDAWLAFNGNKKFKFAHAGDNNIPESADWVDVATATPPQEFDLPLAEGVTPTTQHGGYKNTYHKDQFGKVNISVGVEGNFPNGATIFTLPVGFRPNNVNIMIPCYVERSNLGTSDQVPSFIRIYQDGTGFLYYPVGNITSQTVLASGTFLASS